MQAFVILNKAGMMIKCKCECKELIDKDVCDKGFIWNTSNCECECKNHVVLVNIKTIKTASAGKN